MDIYKIIKYGHLVALSLNSFNLNREHFKSVHNQLTIDFLKKMSYVVNKCTYLKVTTPRPRNHEHNSKLS